MKMFVDVHATNGSVSDNRLKVQLYTRRVSKDLFLGTYVIEFKPEFENKHSKYTQHFQNRVKDGGVFYSCIENNLFTI